MALQFFTIRSSSGGQNGFLTPGAPGHFEQALRQQPLAEHWNEQLFQHWIFTDGFSFFGLDDVLTPRKTGWPKKVFRLMNRATGKVVDAIGGAPLHQGQPLQVFHDGDGPNQRWGVFDAGAAPFGIEGIPRTLVFRAYEVDEFVLAWTVPDGSDAAGVQIQLSPIPDYVDYADEAPNQRWFAQEAAMFADNPVLIRSALDQSVLDIPGFSRKAGELIQHSDKNAGLNQIWALDEVGGGHYIIRSVSNDLVLDVPADENNPPGQITNIQQFPGHGFENQRWRLVSAGGSRVRIESVYSPGFVLDAKVGDDADQIVQVYPWHQGENQKWELVPGYWDAFALPSDVFKIFDS